MRSRGPSLAVGYNTGVQYRDHTYHIQTEDSGSGHPHVITHLFADGGRVIATRRTDYAAYLGTERCPAIVKALVLAQHKAMFVALRDGAYDAVLATDRGSASPRNEPPLDLGEVERTLLAAPAEIVESAAPVQASTSVPRSSKTEPRLRRSSPRIPITDPTEPTIDDVILGELTLFFTDAE